jgi:hypothetical protein
MANTLSKTGITDGLTIQPHHVTQSIDAFTGTEAYDISLSGSLTLTGNQSVTGSLIVSNSITSSALTSDGSDLFLGYSGSNNITINDSSGGGITIDAEGKLIELIGRSNLTLGTTMILDASNITLDATNIITLTGSLVLDLNGGYQMTASAGNYTSLMDFGTGTLLEGVAYTNGKGLITNFKGTYSPITSSLFNSEILIDVGVEITASGHISQTKYSGSVNGIYNTYQDWSPIFSNPAGTNINFVNELASDGDAENNTYSIITGNSVFAGGVNGIYLQGSDDSGVGASLTINETNNTGFRIGSNSANTTSSVVLEVVNEDAGFAMLDIRNNGVIMLSQLSSSFSASDDAGAASIGVPTGGLYHTNGTVKIRLS